MLQYKKNREEDVTQKGILKVKKAFERLKEFSVISFLASASLTVVATFIYVGVCVGYSGERSALDKYKRTQEYKIEITEEVGDVMDQFKNNDISWEEANSKMEYLQGDEYAEKKLMNSSNQELISLKNKQIKAKNGTGYAVIAGCGAIMGTLIASGIGLGGQVLSDNAFERAWKKEEEEAEEGKN